jgi:hypothetical protein
MMEKEWTIGGRNCLLIGQDNPKCLLIWMLGSDERNDVAGMAAMIAAACDVPFVLAAFFIDDWERDLTPWPDPFLDKRPEVGKMAGKTLHAVTELLLPELVKRYGKLPVVLGGYSLAGLFALWGASETDGFDGVAAASPSVWLRDWLSYAESRPVKAKRVYLSLGDREEKTRNPVLSRVGDCIRGEYDLLKQQLGETNYTLEWNVGGHFADADKRLAKGFVWNLQQLTINN